ncbi:MAG: hypothetical protein H6R16_3790 [Proteobacteria bacterium]|nr:hypothetical protein [Pseudomonadota bacterium]
MSSSLNSHIAEPERANVARPNGTPPLNSGRRRVLLMALAAYPLLWLPLRAHASSAPTSPIIPITGLKRWGSGEFRRFGFLVYEATLWAGDDPQRPPLALRLDYKRDIDGKAIAAASVKEMRRFVADESLLQRWGEQMQRLFPDVKPGDHLLGVYGKEGASFYQDDRLLGRIDSPGFADAFFAIWLDARTSAPELRAALLRSGEG